MKKIPKNTNPREYPLFRAPDVVVVVVALAAVVVVEDESPKAVAEDERLPVLEAEVVKLEPLEVTEDVSVEVLVAVVTLLVVLSTASPHSCNLVHPSANSSSHQSPMPTSQ